MISSVSSVGVAITRSNAPRTNLELVEKIRNVVMNDSKRTGNEDELTSRLLGYWTADLEYQTGFL